MGYLGPKNYFFVFSPKVIFFYHLIKKQIAPLDVKKILNIFDLLFLSSKSILKELRAIKGFLDQKFAVRVWLRNSAHCGKNNHNKKK
jgi:hypothetical protein